MVKVYRDFPIELKSIEKNKAFKFDCTVDEGEHYEVEAVFSESKRAGRTVHLSLFIIDHGNRRWVSEADENRDLNNADDLKNMAEEYIRFNLIPITILLYK